MKVNDPNWSHSFLGHLVIRLISDPSVDEATRQRILKFRDTHGTHEFTVTVNGVELDFGMFVRHLEEDIERIAVERAGMLMKERVNDLMDKLHSTTSEINEALRKEAIDRLGYNPWSR